MPHWFKSDLKFTGRASLLCTLPPGKVEGPGIIEILPNQDPKITFQVDCFEPDEPYPGMLYTFLEAEVPVRAGNAITFSKRAEANPEKFHFEAEEGSFEGSRIVCYDGQFGKEPETVVPHVFDLRYEMRNAAEPRYWVIPLRNFTTDYFPQAIPSGHPLVLDPLHPQGIEFAIDGTAAYIQPLNQQPAASNAIDALLVGELFAGLSANWEAMKKTFPFELFSALAFATGQRLSAPWIEFGGGTGELISRLHVDIGRPSGETGHTFPSRFHVGASSGLAAFVTAFLALPPETRHWLQVAMSMCVAATPGTSAIDDNLAFVFRGFELFIRNKNIGRIDLRAQLSKEAAAEFDGAVVGFNSRISQMRTATRASSNLADDRALERIQSRLANVHTTDSDIGMTMSELVRKAGFPDVDILDASYMPCNFEGKTWARVVSELRQDTVHKGYLEFQERHDLRRAFAVLSHLHDLLARLILRECRYLGTYNPGSGRWRQAVPVDWVTSNHTPEKLGFGTSALMET